jgi:hypothetical protein
MPDALDDPEPEALAEISGKFFPDSHRFFPLVLGIGRSVMPC